MMRLIKPNDRAASGPLSPAAVLCHAQFPMSLPVVQTLSLNVFYQSQRRRPEFLRRGNCRSIEVVLLCPLYAPPSPILAHQHSSCSVADHLVERSGTGEGSMTAALEQAKMSADQERVADVSLTSDGLSHESLVSSASLIAPTERIEAFRFLDLPLELRLKIYGYLLPPRTHTIVTQIPFNGYFYNTLSVPPDSATSFYPFGRSAPTSSKQQGYTTYKILTTNYRTDFPVLSIHPELFLVNKQILAEAEPVLYGSNQATWDFGIHLDALLAFWSDRSVMARKCVRNIRIARQIPHHASLDSSQDMDPLWQKACDFIKSEMHSLRKLDLIMWSSIGSLAPFPPTSNSTPEELRQQQKEAECRLHDWEWTSSLLSMPVLRQAKVTWWGFQSEEGVEEASGSAGWSGFGSWIAGRMVGDKLVRDRMIRDGIVVEGVVVLAGPAA